MIADCPHCFTRVYFLPSGLCPSCGASIHSSQGADYTKTNFLIYESDVLPANCYLCDKPTQRVVHWHYVVTHTPQSHSFLSYFSLKGLLTALLNKAAEVEERMTIQLPQCEACNSKPEASHFEFEKREATFVVHKQFAERVRVLRRQSF